MFSRPTTFLAAVVIATGAFATAASAGIEYHGGPKSPWSVAKPLAAQYRGLPNEGFGCNPDYGPNGYNPCESGRR